MTNVNDSGVSNNTTHVEFFESNGTCSEYVFTTVDRVKKLRQIIVHVGLALGVPAVTCCRRSSGCDVTSSARIRRPSTSQHSPSTISLAYCVSWSQSFHTRGSSACWSAFMVSPCC